MIVFGIPVIDAALAPHQPEVSRSIPIPQILFTPSPDPFTPYPKKNLVALPQYVGMKIKCLGTMLEALNFGNEDAKDRDALAFHEWLMKDYGSGMKTECMIRNATEDPLKCQKYHYYHDKLYKVSISDYDGERAVSCFCSRTPQAHAGRIHGCFHLSWKELERTTLTRKLTSVHLPPL